MEQRHSETEKLKAQALKLSDLIEYQDGLGKGRV